MRKFVKYMFLFLFGGILYCFIEVIARGYSHWTMLLTGGVCFVLVGALNEITPRMPIGQQMLISMVVITIIEFVVGCIVNIWLGWNVWNYSDRVFNILGQICLRNSCYWFLISSIAIFIDDCIRHRLFGEEKQKYKPY